MPEILSPFTVLLIWAVVGYLLGSVPFGMVLSKLMGLEDPRNIGSGNIGATNVLRSGNKVAAFGTLVLDGGKGAVAVLLARAFAGEDAAQLAGLTAFAGHCYPVWLGFKGGKGVATFLGLLLALSWPVGILACLSWLAAVALIRISSVGALVAAALSPIWAVLSGHGDTAVLCALLAAMIWWRHRENIARIRAGTESKVGKKT